MSRHERRIGAISRILLVSLIVLGAICLALLIGALIFFADLEERVRCPVKMKDVYELVMQDSGELWNDSLDKIKLPEPQEPNRVMIQCPVAHENYIYRPIAGVPRHWGQKGKDPPPNRMILWCPAACHRGGRNVMMEDGVFWWVNEANFQAALRNNCELASVQYYDDKKVPYSPDP